MVNANTLLTPSAEVINQVSIDECHEPLVDLKLTTDILYGPPPECPETADDYTFVRASVLDRLKVAQRMLPDGIYLRLYEGFRNLKVQALLFSEQWTRFQKSFPQASDSQLFLLTSALVSPVQYSNGIKTVPPHATGAAVDVELVNSKGRVLDFGMEVKEWSLVDPDLCAYHAPGISDQAKANRRLLKKVMALAGFAEYSQEWWHFSYGDRYWAYINKRSHAIYGLVERAQ